MRIRNRGNIARSAALSPLLVGIACFTNHVLAADLQELVLPDPRSVSPKQFLSKVEEIERWHSGSGGYFLGENEIEWILKAESELRALAITVPGTTDRYDIIADSYLNAQDYARAVEFFSRAGNECGLEESLWLYVHAGLRPPHHVQLAELPGPFLECGSENARVETDRYIFSAQFKGPVYRYDKQRRTRAILFQPAWRYDWPSELEWHDPQLFITLVNGEQYRFDMAQVSLTQVKQLEE